MRRMLFALLIPVSMIVVGSAQAGSLPRGVESISKIARAAVIAPSEWDGFWTTADSLYDCQGVFQSTSTGADTICGGKDYTASSDGVQLDCTGTADATTIDVTCTGSGVVFTDCNANFTVVTHGTRTDDTYFIVTTVNVTYSGTGEGCDLVPPSCIQINSHGTRTGSAPVDYCATPTKRSTWGEIKALYR